jgi:hypothetical protein
MMRALGRATLRASTQRCRQRVRIVSRESRQIWLTSAASDASNVTFRLAAGVRMRQKGIND